MPTAVLKYCRKVCRRQTGAAVRLAIVVIALPDCKPCSSRQGLVDVDHLCGERDQDQPCLGRAQLFVCM